MSMWSGYWGPPWAGFGWIFPVVGLLFMVVMFVLCFRMMGGGCMGRHGSHRVGELENLRREVQELKQEIRDLHDRS